MRFRGGEVRQSRAPGAQRHCPLPPCSRAWWGGTRAPADAGCSARSAPRPLQPGASAAHRLPPPHTHAPETRGLQRTYGAPPPARFPRGPWRFRTCESGRSAAQKMDAGGWARTPRSAPGAVQARRPLDLGRRRAGLWGAAGCQAPAPPGATAAAEPGSHRVARPQSRPWAPGAGLAHRSPLQFQPAPDSENKVSPVLCRGCQGTPGLFPTMV